MAGKCSRNGLKVGMWCCYVACRPPAKFHHIWSSFDSPTDNYSDIIVGQTSDVFGLRKQSPGLSLFSSLSPKLLHSLLTTARPQNPLCTVHRIPHVSVRKLSRTRPGLSLPLCPDHPLTSTKRLRFFSGLPNLLSRPSDLNRRVQKRSKTP